MRSRVAFVSIAFVFSAVVLALGGCASMSGGGGTFSLSTTAVSGPAETGFDSGLVSIGRLDAMYGAKARHDQPAVVPFCLEECAPGDQGHCSRSR